MKPAKLNPKACQVDIARRLEEARMATVEDFIECCIKEYACDDDETGMLREAADRYITAILERMEDEKP